jgi:lysozyme
MASRLKKGGAVAAMAIALVGGFEGLRTVAYRDVVGVPTVCYGETAGVRMGDRYTPAQCKAMLATSLEAYAAGIDRCVTAPMTDERFVALVSFAYNVGVGSACSSTAVRLINAGQTRAGCDQLLRWNKAAGIVFPGLTRRREAERALCLVGVSP